LSNDVIYGPDRIERRFEFAPVSRKVIGTFDWWKLRWEEIVDDIMRKRAQQDVEVAGVAAIEVLRTTSMFLVSVAVIFVLLFQAP